MPAVVQRFKVMPVTLMMCLLLAALLLRAAPCATACEPYSKGCAFKCTPVLRNMF